MNLPTLVLVSIGLAMDCLAVSVATGMTVTGRRWICALRLGVTFGAFQAGMFLVGWLFGLSLRAVVAHWDHWLAMALLAFIGVRMIRESFREKTGSPPADGHPSFARLMLLGLATSVDASAVGLGMSLLGGDLLLNCSMVGAFSFGVSIAGVFAGFRLGKTFGPRAELVGGLVLLGIGLDVFLTHLVKGV
jgi:manganese efflux pump family protein